MRRALIVLLASGAAGLAVGAQAAPRAKNVEECGLAADMALVAQSLAAEHIQRRRADAIMRRIYDVAGSPRGADLMREIVDAAYIDVQSGALQGRASAGGSVAGGEAHSFAEHLFAACVQGGGDMDSVLGRRS